MSDMYIALLLIPLGALLGTIAFFSQREIRHRLRAAEQQIEQLQRQLAERAGSLPVRPDEITDAATPEPAADASFPPESVVPSPSNATPASPSEPDQPEETESPWGEVRPARAAAQPPTKTHPPPTEPEYPAARRGHWMIWLGGTSIGLAGVFMVRYSIEQGWLGPGARIVLALITGLLLHIAAEWLRRHRGQSDVFAALAGGASITLYAALLATLYQFPQISPGLIFIAMAFVSLATMALAVVQGPMLAALGLLGGYLVPILVQTGSSGMAIALIYSLIITGSALVLLRYIWRVWLWIGVLLGALFWWLLSFSAPELSDLSRTLYLFLLAWSLLAIPEFDWTLRQHHDCHQPHWWSVIQSGEDEQGRRLFLALTLIGLAQMLLVWHQPFTLASSWSLLLLPLLLLHAAGRRPALVPLPGLMLILLTMALLGQHLAVDAQGVHLVAPRQAERPILISLLLLLPLLNSGYGLLYLRDKRRFTGYWITLASFAPLLILALGYLLFTEFSLDWRWSMAALGAGAVYLVLARYSVSVRQPLITLTLVVAVHAAYSLAAVMWWREASLTLALGVQTISLSYFYRRLPLPLIPWLVHLLLAALACRLVLNPWILSYPSETHWSLWTYGGVTLCCFIASYLSRGTPDLQRWLQGAASTLLMLTLGAELRYWLYDGDIFRHRYDFTEAMINTVVWGGAGLVYYWRASLSHYIAAFYHYLAALLLILACINYLLVVVLVQNPLWADTQIAATPIWNALLLAYGVPTLLFWAAARFYRAQLRNAFRFAAALNLLLFLSLEIRHLWQGALDIHLPTSNGEQYSYSAVWLLLAAIGMTVSIWRHSSGGYRSALALLLVVILKIFIVDLSDLQGLLRVASFMGLGVVLLLLAYLHQRLSVQK